MVMTPGYADQCNNYLDYVQYYDGKPLEVGRMIAILFEQRYQASKQARKAQKSGPGCPSNARICKRSDPV